MSAQSGIPINDIFILYISCIYRHLQAFALRETCNEIKGPPEKTTTQTQTLVFLENKPFFWNQTVFCNQPVFGRSEKPWPSGVKVPAGIRRHEINPNERTQQPRLFKSSFVCLSVVSERTQRLKILIQAGQFLANASETRCFRRSRCKRQSFTELCTLKGQGSYRTH